MNMKLWNTLQLEFFKLRWRMLWLLPVLLLLLQAAWMWWGLKSMSHQEIIQGWQHYLYQLPVLNAIMLPVLMAVMGSRIADIEHKGQMLKLLYTVEERGYVLLAKLLCGGWYLLWILLGQLGTMLAIGMYKGFYPPVPWGYFACYMLFTFLTSSCIYLVQLLISLLIKNQAISLIVGIAGSFCGLFSLFLNITPVNKLILWSYYSQLFLCGMNWDRASRNTEMYWVAPNWGSFLLLAVGFLVTLWIGWRLLERKEC